MGQGTAGQRVFVEEHTHACAWIIQVDGQSRYGTASGVGVAFVPLQPRDRSDGTPSKGLENRKIEATAARAIVARTETPTLHDAIRERRDHPDCTYRDGELLGIGGSVHRPCARGGVCQHLWRHVPACVARHPNFFTSTFSSSPKKNDGKADLEPLCEQKNADTDLTATQSGAGHLSPLERHFDRETRLRRCGPNCEIAKPPWIFRPRWRSAGSARIHTVKYLGSSRKKREKTERRASEAAASPADRPDASSHRARAPTSPREVLAHHRREPGTLEPGRLTARRTPPARETPAKRTEHAGYRADTGDTTPRVTGKGAMRAGREARRGSGEMPRHGR